mgnify:CR=1 FL=1
MTMARNAFLDLIKLTLYKNKSLSKANIRITVKREKTIIIDLEKIIVTEVITVNAIVSL